MTARLCNWGILGAARIARKNWHAIRNSGNGTLKAVASRSAERAEQFIRECQASVPYPQAPQVTSYESLLNDPEIDAVYIPLPTALRKTWVLKAAEAGKHVVCEKPCGVCAQDVADMLDACRQHRVQFMDGVMFVHSQRLEQVGDVLRDGTSVGQVRRIASQFSFHGGEEFLNTNIRADSRMEPLGCLGDLGRYNLRFSLWVMNYERPERVAGHLLRVIERPGESPVPLEFSGELFFSGGVSASFYCSFVTEVQQWADVSGSLGRLHLRDFVLPHYGSETSFDVWNDSLRVEGCLFNMEPHRRRVTVREYSNNAYSAAESNLFRRFGALVLAGQVDPTWGESALATQQVLDACLASARSGGQTIAM
jgi:predicted dehydrogenase